MFTAFPRARTVGFGLALLTLLAAGFASHRTIRQLISADEGKGHSYAVLDSLQDTLVSLGNTIESQGGYVITGESQYEAAHSRAAQQEMQDLRKLRELTADNPSQQQRLDRLDAAVTDRLEISQKIIDARKSKGPDAAAAIIGSGKPDVMTERIRDLVAEMEREETALLQERTERMRAGVRNALAMLIAAYAFSFGLLFCVWFFFGREMKERKRGEKAALQQSTLQQLILADIGDGVAVADEKGNFLIFNDAAERILGVGAVAAQPEEWPERYGMFLPDGLTPCPQEQVPLARAIRGESVDRAEFFIRHAKRPDGLWIEVNGRPLHDAEGRLCGGVVVFRDITEQKKAQEALAVQAELLEQANAELTSANTELETFTYSVSHDLRAPLRHIHGYSKILEEDFGEKLDPDARRYLLRIQDGVQQMGNLIEDLLNLTRIGRQTPNFQITGLNTLVEEVLTDLKGEMEGRKIVWKVGTLPFIECDPVLMRQVFSNLLSNAVKYTRPRQEAVIEIGQTELDGKRILFVRDNGVGFNMKYADKLFGVFQRLHRAEDFEGTGVCLATVQRIVRKHGGKIWAEAELDRGATFYFTINEKAERNSAPQTANPPATRAS